VSYFDEDVISIPQGNLPSFSGPISAATCSVTNESVPYQAIDIYESYGIYYRFNLFSSCDLFVLVYRSQFDPLNPCDSLVGGIFADSDESPKGDFVINLSSDYYTLVVMAPVNISMTSMSSGMFVLNWDPYMSEYPPSGNAPFSSCVTGTSGQPYFASNIRDNYFGGYYLFRGYAETPNGLVEAHGAVTNSPSGYFNPNSTDCSVLLLNAPDGRISWTFQWYGNESWIFFGPPETTNFYISFDIYYLGLNHFLIYSSYSRWIAPSVSSGSPTTDCIVGNEVV
jgi:hypothetical protein